MLVLLSLLSMAAPPSSTLTGPEGTLTWTVAEAGGGLTISGTSPKWTVEHQAGADFTPKRTVHTDADGTTATITYTPTAATVEAGGKTKQVKGNNLWDGDTLDVRLGHNVAAGRTDLTFWGWDPASGKVYGFDTKKVEDTTCGAVPCVQVRVQLTGWLRYVGPTWKYWYGADGKLLRFEGPAGTFNAQ